MHLERRAYETVAGIDGCLSKNIAKSRKGWLVVVFNPFTGLKGGTPAVLFLSPLASI